jgi:predicted anti-sigma-YlaC factor YlaD
MSTDDLDCKAVSRLISAGQDADLPPRERTRLRLHLVLCEACRNVDDQIGFIRRAMRQLDAHRARPARAAPPDPPPDLPPEGRGSR